jgi:very-short-patch-repair endonuclease
VTELVTVGGGLPHHLELQTGKVLDVLLGVLETDRTRKQVNDWLYRNSKPSFVFDLQPKKELYLAYGDQRDGHGTAHWWRLYYGDRLKSQIDTILKGTALTTTSQTPSNQANSGVRAPYEWGGMYFRSKVEIKIAEELERRGVTFFANARGRYSLEGSPVAAQYLNGRVEVDFLVFHQGKCVVLQIDGPQHNGDRGRDYAGDRVLLREGIPTVRFTAKECQERPGEVVSEVILLFKPDIN